MKLDMMEIGFQIRKVARISIRMCYRSACRHPFLVGILCLLFLLYRSFPLLFSVLVSVSPVLVCTAVCLGVLLSFGESNIPEIEIEEKKITRVVSLKTGVSEDETFVHKDKAFFVEKYVGERKDVGEEVHEDKGLRECQVSKVEILKGSDDDNTPLIGENSREIKCEKWVREEVVEGVRDLELEEVRKMAGKSREESEYGDEEVFERGYLLVPKMDVEGFGLESENLLGEFVDDDSIIDHSDPSSHLNKGDGDGHEGDNESSVSGSDDEDDDDEDEDDESSDSGSDGDESSSPDASMTDIMPMLNELHPLLDVDAPQPARMSHESSDANSVRSDEDSDALEENGEEEEAHGDNKEGEKPVIIWTEDDQKNLMDLGTSELERNQRLENLIARRRARKNMRLMAEKNLIDLESNDLPFNNIPSISVTRQNPFDFPYDSYDDMGLPPIPGSAPSILLPRRNPFDLPYDSSEEKPDLMADSFQQEFTVPQPKDTSFRRFESFNVGPSRLGGPGPRQETLDMRWKPYFVPERLASEGTSYPAFLRQLSELSESKASSVPETESVCSVAEPEDRNISGSETLHETETISVTEPDPNLVESSRSEYQLVAEPVGEESDESSLSSPVLRINTEHDEIEMKMGQDMENYEEVETRPSDAVELNRSEIYLNAEEIEQDSDKSSLSSLSEANEEIFEVNGGSTSLDVRGDLIEEPSNLMQSPLDESNFNFASRMMENHQEPVYDSSPQASEKYLSFSSSSSGQLEISELGSPPVSSGSAIPFVNKGSEAHNESTDVVSTDNEMNSGFSPVSEASKIEFVSREINEANEHDFTGSPIYDRNSGDLSGSVVFDSIVEQKSNDSRGPPLGSAQEFDDHKEILERSSVVALSTEKASTTSSNVKMSDHSLEDRIFQDVSVSIPSEEPKAESSECVILGAPIFDKIEKEHHTQELEEIDDRKEMDGFLAELDTIGDFSTKDMGLNKIQVYQITATENINLPIAKEGENLLEPRSREQLDKSSVQFLNAEQISETKLDLPVVEARSFEDVSMAFKQLAEGVDVQKVILPSSIKDGQNEVDPRIKDSNIQVVVARSLENIHMALKEVSEGDQDQQPSSISVSGKSFEIKSTKDSSLQNSEVSSEKSSVQRTSSGVDPGNTEVNLQISEKISLGDICTALKEVSESNEDKQPISKESGCGKLTETEENEGSPSQNSEFSSEKYSVQGISSGVNPEKTDVNLQVVEARSPEVIDIDPKKLSEATEEKQSISMVSISGEMVEIKRDQESSSSNIELSSERSSVPGTISYAPGIPHDEFGESSKKQAPEMKKNLEGIQDKQPVSMESVGGKSITIDKDGESSSRNVEGEKSFVQVTSAGTTAVGKTSEKEAPEIKKLHEDNEDKPIAGEQVNGESVKIKGNEDCSSKSTELSTEKPSAQGVSSGALGVCETSTQEAPETKESFEGNQDKKPVSMEQVSGESISMKGNEESSSKNIELSTEKPSAQETSSGALGMGEISKQQAPETKEKLEGNQDKKPISTEQVAGESIKTEGIEESSSKSIDLSTEIPSAQGTSSDSLGLSETSKKEAPEMEEKREGNQDEKPIFKEEVSGESIKIKRNEESSCKSIDLSTEKSSSQETSSDALGVSEKSEKQASETKEKLEANQDKHPIFMAQISGESVKIERNEDSSSKNIESRSEETSVSGTSSGAAGSLHNEVGEESKDSGLSNVNIESKVA